jgi:hypothetical protein
MASFLDRAGTNSRVQLAATAIVSGAVVAGAILGYQQLRQEERVYNLKNSIPFPEDEGEALRKVGNSPA